MGLLLLLLQHDVVKGDVHHRHHRLCRPHHRHHRWQQQQGMLQDLRHELNVAQTFQKKKSSTRCYKNHWNHMMTLI